MGPESHVKLGGQQNHFSFCVSRILNQSAFSSNTNPLFLWNCPGKSLFRLAGPTPARTRRSNPAWTRAHHCGTAQIHQESQCCPQNRENSHNVHLPNFNLVCVFVLLFFSCFFRGYSSPWQRAEKMKWCSCPVTKPSLGVAGNQKGRVWALNTSCFAVFLQNL